MTGEASIDVDRLHDWLRGKGVDATRVQVVGQLSGGTQNELLRLRSAERDYVLRMPRIADPQIAARTTEREIRVLRALEPTDLPCPDVIAACLDPAVLGSTFYLMTPVEGFNPNVELPGRFGTDPQWRRRLGLCMAGTAAQIGSIDHLAIGLADFGRADGYLERQVARWQTQLRSYQATPRYTQRDLGALTHVAQWLTARRPESFRPGLMHGDFHLGNVLVSHEKVSINAVVDWELATVGDPLIDLGWLLATWPDGDPRRPGVKGAEPWDGFPQPDELVAEYERAASRPVENIEWYHVLACYKLASILEGTFARSRAGEADAALGERFHQAAVNATDRAVSAAGL